MKEVNGRPSIWIFLPVWAGSGSWGQFRARLKTRLIGLHNKLRRLSPETEQKREYETTK
jgi:hypothetical protein